MTNSGTPEDLRKAVEHSIRELDRERGEVRVRPIVARVDLSVEPVAIPLESIDLTTVIRLMQQELGSRLDKKRLLSRIPSELQVPGEISTDEIVRSIVDGGAVLPFMGGILRLPAVGRRTTINQIGIGSQQVSSLVAGTTDEALYVAQRACLLLWAAAGVEMTWDEFSKNVGAMSFSCETDVELGFSLVDLCSPAMRAFLDEDISGANGFGKEMGLRPSDSTYAAEQKAGLRAVHWCNQLEIGITLHDGVSGRSEECKMFLSVHERSKANRGWLKIVSELPSEKHVQLVQALIRRVKGA